MPDIEIPEDVKDRQEKQVGLTIAILAILLAVVSALGNEQDNEKIVKQIEASNGFAWYQSKRIRAGMNELTLEQLKIDVAGNVTEKQLEAVKKLEARLVAKNAEYKAENDQILKDAEASKKASEIADARGNRYDRSEIFLQIAVVFCSITLLTKVRTFFFVGLLLAVLGTGIGVWAFMS
jgi:putative lipase involved disintegration of autophagic bodies